MKRVWNLPFKLFRIPKFYSTANPGGWHFLRLWATFFPTSFSRNRPRDMPFIASIEISLIVNSAAIVRCVTWIKGLLERRIRFRISGYFEMSNRRLLIIESKSWNSLTSLLVLLVSSRKSNSLFGKVHEKPLRIIVIEKKKKICKTLLDNKGTWIVNFW